ncbi:CAP domain-containing protein [Maribacter sp. 2307ULW6-5]|uniref:CAP domain-containing protein n=1 Tax=Maribacter sp. 2307ULW6-5 TaxID=3386275 RepID=UPI0039BD3295
MKMRLLYAVPMLLMMLFSCTKDAGDQELFLEENTNNAQLEGEVLALINAHRKSLGKNSLEFSAVAYTYANEHTDYMIAQGTLSHDHFSARAAKIAAESEAVKVGENVARKFNTAEAAFASWQNSSAHKQTMEDDFTHTAVSVKEDGTGNYYYTQLFYKK